MISLHEFVKESNRIEGIMRPPTVAEIEAHKALLARPEMKVAYLQEFVSRIEPTAMLRDRPGLNVRVGNHVPILGGPDVKIVLSAFCSFATLGGSYTPYKAHLVYETIHPFTDGNGRSGRALWLWMIQRSEWGNNIVRTFLHQFYYQTLDAYRVK